MIQEVTDPDGVRPPPKPVSKVEMSATVVPAGRVGTDCSSEPPVPRRNS